VASPPVPQEFEDLLEYVRAERGFDFTGYKRPSLLRRVGKRMQELRIATYPEYQDYLRAHPEEFVGLFNTILINVTGFFRDQVPWDFVASEIVPRIVEQRAPDAAIRAWSTGCATGEEAYTLAILLAEAMGEDQFRDRVKVYATDIDEDALALGRQAAYTSKQIEPVPAELRDRYFEPNGEKHVFRVDLRRSVIFGRHDLIQDPPISRIDLLVSRNTLMYFTAQTQEKILGSFHFALRDEGFILLGKSEVLITRSPLFVPVDLKRRVFAKAPREGQRERAARVRPTDEAALFERLTDDLAIRDAGLDTAPIAQLVVNRLGELTLANQQARLLFGLTHTDLSRPLESLEVSYRPVELRSRIEEAYAQRHTVTVRGVEVEATGGETRLVDVQVAPLVSGSGEIVGAGITFADVTPYRRLEDALRQSKSEMENAYEELQSTVEELETTNEELQSTNEELETTNEELQSTNEELETMNEELQSTNEELETMNDELGQRTEEVHEANAFLESILGGLGAGIAVLDRELQVRAWNRGAEELWGLRADEVTARHFMNLDIGLPLGELRGVLMSALAEDADAVEREVAAVNRRGRTIDCTVRVTPMRERSGTVRGLIVMMNGHGGESTA
jgi:two-component system CheB/CheR fusion protein